EPSRNRQRRLKLGSVQAERPNLRSQPKGHFQTGIIDGMLFQLLDVEVLKPVQDLIRFRGAIQMDFVSHRAIDLLKCSEAIAQVRRYEKRRELAANNEDAKSHQKHDQDDGNKSDEKISHNQAPAKPPEQAAPDECREPPQIV